MPSYTRKVGVSGKSAQELYDKLASEIERFIEKASIGKCDIDRNPQSRVVSLKSSMFSATLRCEEGEIVLDAKLSLLAAPFRSKIDEGIDKWVARTFQKA